MFLAAYGGIQFQSQAPPLGEAFNWATALNNGEGLGPCNGQAFWGSILGGTMGEPFKGSAWGVIDSKVHLVPLSIDCSEQVGK